jgi:hypothetical protein
MKRLHFDVACSMVATPILMFPFAWAANKWLQGISDKDYRLDKQRNGIKQIKFLRDEHILSSLFGVGLHKTSPKKIVY